MLVFQAELGSTGADDSNCGQNKVVGIVKNVKQAAEQEESTNLGRTKRQQVLKDFNDMGAGWNTVRQQVYILPNLS